MDKCFCSKCGKELDAGTNFCMYCGAGQPPSPASPADAQSVSQPVTTQAPLPPPSGPKPKKRWPLFVGIGVGVVVVAAAVLLLTGVIRFGGAPAFNVADINGGWNGTVRTDSVSGAGSESGSLQSQIGQTGPLELKLTLDQNGKGTAVVSGQSMSAELNGSTLAVNGQFNQYSGGSSQSTTFSLTGDITKDANTYSLSGKCSIAMSGVTVTGTATLRHTASGQNTISGQNTVPAATPPAVTTNTLEGTYQYMYDVENSDAAGIEFQRNGTCVLYDTADDSRIPATYVISGDTLNMTLYPDSEETVYQTYKIVIGTGRITLTMSGESIDFIRAE
jgi:hypothetical protein